MSSRGNYIINIAGICNQSISDRTYLVQHDFWSNEKYGFNDFINFFSFISFFLNYKSLNISPSSHYIGNVINLNSAIFFQTN